MFQRFFNVPTLTRRRAALALAVAVAADGMQIGLGPLGWLFFDEVIDVLAMAVTTLLLGFHPLLLPTFVIEVVPVVDMLPTWTACVGAVLVLRRRSTRGGDAPGSARASTPTKPPKVIDV